ncbi:MAG TPA: IPT/TIG domain-containing protein [Capsulimonadaceae bacterium]
MTHGFSREAETDFSRREPNFPHNAAHAALRLVVACLLAFALAPAPRAHAAPTVAQQIVPPGWTATPPVIGKAYVAPLFVPHTSFATIPYGPSPIRGAYGIPALPLGNATGAGVTIAVVDAYGDINSSGTDLTQSDLAAFSARYGLPYNGPATANPTMTIVRPNGPPSSNNTSWALETAMDVEWVHAMAPDANILLVIAPNNGSSLYDAVAYAAQHASIVSMSWGGSEFNGQRTMDTVYFSAPNVTYFVSTGDNGAGVSYPSSSPNVTAVGGTTLRVDSSNNWVSETGWSGSGGGISAYEPYQAFQSSWVASGNRRVPDVSALADPNTGVLVVQGGGTYQVGGTSLSCPLWAGFMGLVNGNRATPIGQAELFAGLYSLGASASLDTYFHDITSGSNGFATSIGYDMVTGIGAPIVNVLLPALVGTGPTITGFSPANGPAGTTVTINGNKLTGGAVTFNGLAAVVSSNTATQIVTTVPNGATTGPIEVTTSAGTGTSATDFAVGIITPVISSLSPSSVVGGAAAFTLTVTGTGFMTGAQISVGGTVLTTARVSSTTLTASVPATKVVTPGSVAVTVTNPAPNASTSEVSNLTVTNPAAVISTLAPATVLLNAADFTLTVNGSKFVSGAVVSIGATTLTTTFIGTTKLTAVVPSSTVGSVGGKQITVTNPGASASTASTLTVNYPIPSITSMTPTTLLRGSGATTLTITGKGFQDVSTVKVAGTAQAATLNQDGTLSTTLAPGSLASAGPVNIAVFNPTPGGGTSGSSVLTVTNPVPTVTSISPSTAVRGVAFTITVTGTNFVPGSKVTVGGTAMTSTYVNATTVTTTVPVTSMANVSSVAIGVSNPTPGGGVSGTVTLSVDNAVPVISALSPSTIVAGSASTTVTVTGTGLVSGSTVKLNGDALTTTFVTGGSLKAVIDSTALTTAGPLSITVTAPTPGGGTSAAATLTVNNRVPVLTSFTPTTVAMGASSFALTATGTGIVTGSQIKVAGTALTTTLNNDGTLSATVPATAVAVGGLIPVVITAPTPGGGASAAKTLTVNNPVAAITALSPSTVTRSQSSFLLTVKADSIIAGAKIVAGGVQLPTTFNGTDTLTATVPASVVATSSSVAITVLNPTPGGGASSASSLTVLNGIPLITTVSPTTALCGSASAAIAVTGWGFVAGSTINIDGTPLTTTGSGTTLKATIPGSALVTAGPIAITVTAPTPGGGTSTAAAFTVNNRVPVLTSISPATVAMGASSFTLTATGTGIVSGSQIKVAGTALTTTLNEDGTLSATVPASAVSVGGLVPVIITAPTPGGGSSAAKTLTVNNPVASISAISPSTVTRSQSSFLLTVKADNIITGAKIVAGTTQLPTTFNGTDTLTATVPASVVATASSVAITVLNPTPGGGASSASTLTVLNGVPLITTVSPTTVLRNSASAAITVTGWGYVAGSTINIDGTPLTTTGSGTTLKATIPGSALTAAGPIAITVTAPTPGGGTSAASSITVNNGVPQITALSTRTVALDSDTFTLTITGLRFVAGCTVTVGGAALTPTANQDGTLSVDVPDTMLTTAATLAVIVTAPAPGGGSSAAMTLTVANPVPAITSIWPTTVVRSAQPFTVTVTGTNFVLGSVINAGGVALTTTVNNDGTLSASIPASAVAKVASLAIKVVNPAPGGGSSVAATLAVSNAVPVIATLTPSTVTMGAASSITITGTGLVTGTKVTVAGVTYNATANANGSLTFTLPATAMTSASPVSLIVTAPTPGGGDSNALSLTVNNRVPTVTIVSPASVVRGAADFTVTLTGAGFVTGSVISLNGSPLTTTLNANGTLSATIVSASVASAGKLQLTVSAPPPGGGVSSAATLTVNNPMAKITSISPTSATRGGATFTLTATGTGFVPESVIKVGVTALTTTLNQDGTLSASVPSGTITTAGAVAVTVVNPTPGGGTSTAATLTSLNPAPSITAVSPSSVAHGSVALKITVTGTGIVQGSVIKVNSTSLTTTFANGAISGTIPATLLVSAGTLNITVFNPTPGGGTSSAATFTVN